jgi:hypothetical protein
MIGIVEQLRRGVTEAAPSSPLPLAALALVLVLIGIALEWTRSESLSRSFLERDGVTELAVGSVVSVATMLILSTVNLAPPVGSRQFFSQARNLAVPATGGLILIAILVVNYRSRRSADGWPLARRGGADLYVDEWMTSDGDGLKLVALLAAPLVVIGLLSEFDVLNAHLAAFPAVGVAVILVAVWAGLSTR